jgi:hypothetical protein
MMRESPIVSTEGEPAVYFPTAPATYARKSMSREALRTTILGVTVDHPFGLGATGVGMAIDVAT